TVDPNSKFVQLLDDGADVVAGDVAFTVTCSSQALLKGERLALNIMQHMSGIATLSNQYKFEVEDLPVTLLDTRKTTPLMRVFEKEAVRLGGNTNYRMGLYDRFMIKDNHIDACGGVVEAINKIMEYKKQKHIDIPITIEVRNLVELYQVLDVGEIDRIMLDNFEPRLLAEAITTINGRFETEASGGINIHNVREMAKTGVQFISVGALTHSAPNMDMSLKIVKD
ncbi:MAG TPA: carboxylating nicotinate-nucleotide diphosphorylase, partial [Saprospiraceae bacterium]|nr:carboxylating nicotinate-nucleotide diphosphorylase [Saprospiraceae bacterium]